MMHWIWVAVWAAAASLAIVPEGHADEPVPYGIHTKIVIGGQTAGESIHSYSSQSACWVAARHLQEQWDMPTPPECKRLESLPSPHEKET